jgi:hypothetical protein
VGVKTSFGEYLSAFSLLFSLELTIAAKKIRRRRRKRKKWIMNSWRNSYGSRIVIHAGWVNELMGLMLDKKL